ncbi:hypothetical protein H9Y04_41040 [Streptomyces sp. TRM66268-LWL]|uniref:Uncharacterized protein n=1 Tax=Streptomyces polyasparticus TaxID=2767826 RepID=A0ABR7SWG4_9ACTN|nr:hypothetical protein [Streptomyces polyasparticus]MBC9718932.1 hypothetical protein [Streptomyces polyasparticus]
MPRSDDEFDAFVRKDHAALVFHLVVLGFPQQLAQDAAQEAVTMLFLEWSAVDHPRAWVRVAGVVLDQRNGKVVWSYRLAPAPHPEAPISSESDPHGFVLPGFATARSRLLVPGAEGTLIGFAKKSG